MWNGYLAMGGLEILNSPRAVAYSRGAGCPVWWLTDPEPCDTLEAALGAESEYDIAQIADAPWYDARVPASARFYGAYVIDLENLSASTREAEVTQRIGPGGVVGAVREGSRRVRATVMLTAQGMDALEVGEAWLKATTKTDACGMHGDDCTTTDMEFFVQCPPARSDFNDVEIDWQRAVDDNRRYLHSVACISGPLPIRELQSANGYFHGRIVQLIFEAESPWVYGKARELTLPPITPAVMQDVPYNLAQFPSAEASGASAFVAINYSPNPSAETDATGWSAQNWIVSGDPVTPYHTWGRVTGELAAAGTSAIRSRILGNGSTAAAGRSRLEIYQAAASSLYGTGYRYSFSIWAALLSVGGATGATLVSLEAFVEWRNGTTVLQTVSLGSTTDPADFGGKVFAAKSLPIPAGGVTNVRTYVRATVDWSSNAIAAQNSDIRLYVDAHAVTRP